MTENNKSEALKLAGKLSIAANSVITSSATTISERVEQLNNAVNEYDSFVFNDLKGVTEIPVNKTFDCFKITIQDRNDISLLEMEEVSSAMAKKDYSEYLNDYDNTQLKMLLSVLSTRIKNVRDEQLNQIIEEVNNL